MVAKKAQELWSKMLELLGFWKGRSKLNQPMRGKQGENKVMRHSFLKRQIDLSLSSSFSLNKLYLILVNSEQHFK